MNEITELKYCSKCKIQKNKCEFGKSKDKKDGLYSLCKLCAKENRRKYYLNNIDKVKQRRIRYEKEKGIEWKKEIRKKYTEKNKNNDTYRQSLHKYVKEWGVKNKVSIILYTAKSRAKKKNIPFDLTLDDIVIPDLCPVLGIPIIKNCKGYVTNPNSPSLDRIDNNKGYVKGNVKVISWLANQIKSCGNARQHRLIADYIDNNTKDNIIIDYDI